MEIFDALGDRVVTTARGPVEVSVAGHDDGSVSVVAWLLPEGRRVGYLRSLRRWPAENAVIIDPSVCDDGLDTIMRTLLEAALGRRLDAEPIGQTLVRAGLLTQEDVRELLGWQWLLDELGEHRRLGDLACAAGLIRDGDAPLSAGEESPRDGSAVVLPPPGQDGWSAGAVL